MIRAFLLALAGLTLTVSAHAQDVLSIGSFNVESDLDTEAERVAEDFARIPPLHIWALQEVYNDEALDLFTATLSEATGFTYASHRGTTGSNFGDYLAFVYVENAFSDVSFEELGEVGGARHPLVMRATSFSGHELTFVNTHLDRGDARAREGQARSLRSWVIDHEDEALIMMGTFNFDYDFAGTRRGGNRAFVNFSRGGHVSWPEPMCIAGETCPVTGTQCNPQYNNMLDFIFLAGTAFDWRAMTDLAFLGEDYCSRDPQGYSDHRPVLGQLLME